MDFDPGEGIEMLGDDEFGEVVPYPDPLQISLLLDDPPLGGV